MTAKQRRQTLAIASLCIGASYKQAAKDAGVTEATIKRWASTDDVFQADLDTAVKTHIATFRERLDAEWPASLDKLCWLRDNAESDSVQLRAAQDILDRAGVRVLPEENDETISIVFDMNSLDRM